jgi:hypothetical protein
MNVSTTLFKFFSFKTFKNSVTILFLLVSRAILLAFHEVAQPHTNTAKNAQVVAGITGQR